MQMEECSGPGVYGDRAALKPASRPRHSLECVGGLGPALFFNRSDCACVYCTRARVWRESAQPWESGGPAEGRRAAPHMHTHARSVTRRHSP